MIQRLLGVRTEGPDLDVHLDDAGAFTVLQFRHGELATVNSPQFSSPALSLRSHEPGLLATICGDRRIRPDRVEASIPGWEFLPIHPFDCGPQPADTSVTANINVTVQHGQYGSPVGDIHFVDRFVHGVLVAREHGVHPGSDAIVRNLYENVDASNNPTIPILEAIRGANVSARDPAMLMIIAALYDNPILRAHLNQRHAVSQRLCQLARHTQHPAWLRTLRGHV